MPSKSAGAWRKSQMKVFEVVKMRFDDYATKYSQVRMERQDGILQLTLHSNNAEFKWSALPHEEYDVARDDENRYIIITGTGNAFCAEMNRSGGPGGLQVSEEHSPPRPAGIPPTNWDHIYSNAKYLLTNLLNIEVPMIAVVNGPALIHAGLAVLCDIVLASENAEFQDAPHFPNGVVPGDGVNLVWPLVLGPHRGRYFLLTGQKISASDALSLGVVSEVLTCEALLPRAWQLARQIVAQPRSQCVTRASRSRSN